MDFWPEFLANSWGREFVAGGCSGTAGVIAGYPLDTLRVRQQHTGKGSAFHILRRLVAADGPFALYRGMTAPLASVTFQNAIAFQTYAILSKAVDTKADPDEPPSYTAVALGGFGTGAIQSLLLSFGTGMRIVLLFRVKACVRVMVNWQFFGVGFIFFYIKYYISCCFGRDFDKYKLFIFGMNNGIYMFSTGIMFEQE